MTAQEVYEDEVEVLCVCCSATKVFTVMFDYPSDEARCEALRFEMTFAGWWYSVTGNDVCPDCVRITR